MNDFSIGLQFPSHCQSSAVGSTPFPPLTSQASDNGLVLLILIYLFLFCYYYQINWIKDWIIKKTIKLSHGEASEALIEQENSCSIKQTNEVNAMFQWLEPVSQGRRVSRSLCDAALFIKPTSYREHWLLTQPRRRHFNLPITLLRQWSQHLSPTNVPVPRSFPNTSLLIYKGL